MSDQEVAIREEMVRDALMHLYDNAYLLQHPLLPLLVKRHVPDPLARAQQLRSVIIEAVHSLTPPAPVVAKSKEWRPYGVLILRYVDRMSDERIQRDLAISERQLFRDLKAGIALLTVTLRAQAGGEGELDQDALATSLQEVGLRLERLDLNALGSQVLPLVQGLSGALGKVIHLQPAPAEAIAVADLALSRQALISALSHALHHAGGDVCLRVVTDQETQALVLQFQREAAATQAPPSEALGLARQLLEQQGGSLQLEDGEQGERCISLHWSRFEEPAILIVDDDPAMLRLFGRYLAGHGYRVVSTNDGSEAVKLAGENYVRLVILDVMMRDMDGWTVLQQLKADPATGEVPVLVCSVINEPQLALALGATALLRKPVRQEQLLSTVMEIVGI